MSEMAASAVMSTTALRDRLRNCERQLGFQEVKILLKGPVTE